MSNAPELTPEEEQTVYERVKRRQQEQEDAERFQSDLAYSRDCARVRLDREILKIAVTVRLDRCPACATLLPMEAQEDHRIEPHSDGETIPYLYKSCPDCQRSTEIEEEGLPCTDPREAGEILAWYEQRCRRYEEEMGLRSCDVTPAVEGKRVLKAEEPAGYWSGVLLVVDGREYKPWQMPTFFDWEECWNRLQALRRGSD